MSFGKLIADRHKRVARAVGYALTCESKETWADVGSVWVARLSERERVLMAWSLLRVLPPELASGVMQTAHPASDCPLPVLASPEADAASWAAWADYRYVGPCTLAGFNRLTPEDQVAFLEHVQGRTAA